ncbi:MAG: acetolactate decarboxylase [Candidatus Bathyarchaeota archaeon]|nr:acetolactate decarboxylase [Candidatus Bathyarchaeota archaeon]
MMGFRYFLAATVLVALITGMAIYSNLYSQDAESNEDIIYQTSTINALVEGVYDGDITFEELRKHGDFGLGTFNQLDGEMIALDGDFYQIKSNGIAYLVDDSMLTPFSIVTFFESDDEILLQKSKNYSELEHYLDDLLPTENIFYAIKIEGTFDYIKARSVPGQNKPYSNLTIVVQNQSIFEFNDVNGTIVGFRTPEYVGGINVPGYHLHFITNDKQAGGHVLEFEIENVSVNIDYTSDFYLVLPENKEFYEHESIKEMQKDIERIEK